MLKPKILVIRNDKLGDFMLAWPAFALLKQQYPKAIITALVPAYTKDMAELCPWIDNTIIDNRSKSIWSDASHLARIFKEYKFDTSISFFSEMRTSLAVFLAQIPSRYGPATKLAQVFLNKTLKQKRSLSLKPEYEYNSDLVKNLIHRSNATISNHPAPPYLKFTKQEISKKKTLFLQEKNIDKHKRLIFIHAGTGGSAVNLSLQQFTDLASGIYQEKNTHFILTAGPGEEDIAYNLSKLMKNTSHSIYHSTKGLVNFSKFMAIADLFISGSTGPLHIAGALDVPTVAFYPARRSATSLRWQTLNSSENRISFSPEKNINENDMSKIDIENCAKKIVRKYFV